MQFQHKTEHGVALIGAAGHVEGESPYYLVVFRAENFQFQEQIAFEFAAICGHPALIREFANVGGPQMKSSDERPIELLTPKCILMDDLPGIRSAAAEVAATLIEYYEATVVIEPSAKFKRAMRRLMQVKENPDLLDAHVPPHLKDFMHSQFEDLLNYLRQAPNAMRADQMADRALKALQHYGIKEASRGELKLN